MKSRLVARIGTEERVFFSEVTVLVEMAIGAAAETFSIFLITPISETERLDFWKELAIVSSSTILVTVSLVELGRTTIISPPSSLISFLTRLEMLPIRERIRIMLATPIAIPRQVRKERVWFSLMAVRASL